MDGCELRGNKSKGGVEQHGYNGRTFLTFDKETLTWVAPVPQARITQRKWDALPGYNQRTKFFLEEFCIEWLEKYLSYGKETLLRTEPPEVTMSSKMEVVDGMETHVCCLYGFYPREIDAFWTRDGEVWLPDTLRGSVAPNADGTFHAWLSIQIDPKERGRYHCHVEHDGLQEPLDVALKEPKSNLGLIIGYVVVGLVLMMCAIVGILVFLKRRQDDGSATSVDHPERVFLFLRLLENRGGMALRSLSLLVWVAVALRESCQDYSQEENPDSVLSLVRSPSGHSQKGPQSVDGTLLPLSLPPPGEPLWEQDKGGPSRDFRLPHCSAPPGEEAGSGSRRVRSPLLLSEKSSDLFEISPEQEVDLGISLPKSSEKPLGFWGGAGSTSSHTMKYFSTAISEPSQGLPQFVSVGYVDGQIFVHYNSSTRRREPQVSWMEKVGKEDPQYWDRNTQIVRATEEMFRRNLETLRRRYNQNESE
ncbi:major histocompatibility complex class I-related protein-like [Crotalus adamanteus]|uniref:Major histocompatibility complex class I-related protein-like n=1 Tax=Crotalus adamanteus TaxID=8729 RepID=A0AAW1BTF1_CROAD